jgi:hypothetical protein
MRTPIRQMNRDDDNCMGLLPGERNENSAHQPAFSSHPFPSFSWRTYLVRCSCEIEEVPTYIDTSDAGGSCLAFFSVFLKSIQKILSNARIEALHLSKYDAQRCPQNMEMKIGYDKSETISLFFTTAFKLAFPARIDLLVCEIFTHAL